MKINRFLVLVTTLVGITYTQARAEDCVYSYGSWGNGVVVYYDCYTDSSHSALSSQKDYWISLSENDGWIASTGSDGKPIITNTNGSGISYSLETAPMKRVEEEKYYENGAQKSYKETYTDEAYSSSHEVEYYENGIEKSVKDDFIDWEGNRSFNEDERYEDGTRKSEKYGYTYSDGYSEFNEYEWYEDGTQKSVKYLETSPYRSHFEEGKLYENGNWMFGIVNEVSYDENGNVISTWESLSENYENGNTKSYKDKYADSDGCYTDEEKYDEDGKIISYNHIDYNADGNVISTCEELYESDENGYLVIHRLICEYDEQGRIIQKKEEYLNTARGKRITVGIWSYEYDDKGGYVVTDANGAVVEIHEPKPEPKRIYTVEEATAAVSGKGKNKFIIRYR